MDALEKKNWEASVSPFWLPRFAVVCCVTRFAIFAFLFYHSLLYTASKNPRVSRGKFQRNLGFVDRGFQRGGCPLWQRKRRMSITALMLFFLCGEASNETGPLRKRNAVPLKSPCHETVPEGKLPAGWKNPKKPGFRGGGIQRGQGLPWHTILPCKV